MANEPIKENAPPPASDSAESAQATPAQDAFQSHAPTTPATTEAIQAEKSGKFAIAPAKDVPKDAAREEPKVVAQPSFEGFDLVLAFLVLVLVFLLGSFLVTNSDVLMHLATGRLIAQGDYQFGVDPYSFMTQATATQAATPWINHSWLYSFVLYLLYGLVGEAGLVVFNALIGVALAVVLLSIRDNRSPLLLGVFFIGLTFVALSPRFLLGPTALSMLLFGVTLYLLYRGGVWGSIEPERLRPRWLWGVPLLCVLWVNLDAWFILGPLTLGLVWLGTGLNRVLGVDNPVPGKVLGQVFGVSLLACLLNPHFHQVFILPADLAYLFVRVGLSPPEWLAPAGYAMQEYARNEPVAQWLSPFASAYSTSTALGYNVAGWSFFLVGALSLLTFVLQGLAGAQQGRVSLNGTRTVPWFVLGILAFNSAPLIPWFVAVAGPLAVLNLGEWLAQRQAGEAKTEPGIGRLGRIATLLLLLVALTFAWPGWLHATPGNFAAARRVGWGFAFDPSLIGLGERLGELHQAGNVKNVFNFNLRVGNYVAWYAPGVRCFSDERANLFALHAKSHGEWRKSLLDGAVSFFGGKGGEDVAWREAFLDHHVDHFVLISGYPRDTPGRALMQRLWIQPAEWTLQYVNSQVLLIAWGGRTTPDESYLARRTREIFTEVPAERRPPAGGLAAAPELDTWALFAKGKGRRPGLTWDGWLFLDRYHAPWTISRPDAGPLFMEFASHAATVGQAVSYFLAGPAEGANNTLAWSAAMTVPARNYQQIVMYPSGRSFPRPLDYSLPALPLMLVQDARRVLEEYPGEITAHTYLVEAYRILDFHQEEYWVNFKGLNTPYVEAEWNRFLRPAFEKGPLSWRDETSLLRRAAPQFDDTRRILENRFNRNLALQPISPAPSLRRQLRNIQVMAHLKRAADLNPEDGPLLWNLGQEYQQHYFLDLALEQMQKSLAALEAKSDGADAKELKAKRQFVERLEKGVKERADDFDRIASSILTPVFKGREEAPKWLQIYELALNAPFGQRGKGEDLSGRGLARSCMEKLEASEPKETEAFDYFRLDLKLRTGHVKEVADYLAHENVKNREGRFYERIRALAAGALGDYAAFDRHVAALERYYAPDVEALEQGTRLANAVRVASMLASAPEAPPAFGFVRFELQGRPDQAYFPPAIQEQLFHVRQHLVEFKIVRGLMALEAGDGIGAKRRFEEARQIAGPFVNHYAEMAIANRYLDWLYRYQK